MQSQPPAGLPQQGCGLYEQDQGHLKVLSICYYVSAGLSVLLALFFCIYLVMGGVMMSGSLTPAGGSTHDQEAMQLMGGMFFGIGLVMVLFTLLMAVLEFIVARKIVRRQSRILCMVVAGINCLNMPLGTALGVFTFIVLCRPQVAASFDQESTPPSAAG